MTLLIHLKNVRGIKTIINQIKEFDSSVKIKDDEMFYSIESDKSRAMAQYDYMSGKHVIHIFTPNDIERKGIKIPIRFLECLF